ncbi:MAG: hypothetical protein KJO31_11935 [Gammaproteobacteria bacterium]|nr:hypothetical protein [Gammaproteobacteria bacterium]
MAFYQEELLYSINSVVIAVGLFLLIMLANEIAYRIARRSTTDEGLTTQTNAIQAGILGLLALLLGFSFNMALQRFDARSTAAIEEANAIGTAWLRTSLLPEQFASETGSLISDYVDVRLKGGGIDMADPVKRDEIAAQTVRLQAQLWRILTDAAASDLTPAKSGLVIQALNEMIDAYGKRQAQLDKHVPEVVLILLFVIFIVSGGILGAASGLAGGRPLLATMSMSALIVLVIFIVIDLDRPRRGLIQVDQSSMLALRLQIDTEFAR